MQTDIFYGHSGYDITSNFHFTANLNTVLYFFRDLNCHINGLPIKGMAALCVHNLQNKTVIVLSVKCQRFDVRSPVMTCRMSTSIFKLSGALFAWPHQLVGFLFWHSQCNFLTVFSCFYVWINRACLGDWGKLFKHSKSIRSK